MKTKQVMHFCNYGKEYCVIKRLSCTELNQYRIYHIYSDIGPDGRIHSHKKQVAAYADMGSCFYWFIQNNIV